ncbi:ABC transporter ATP-binding protein [Numidum massiliense]|uniref:ABC transporter ATP-binding protein n=1 Tax=Numidum massiliense TaxID=1522315 RepID=UPI0011C74BC8|nr:ABC transporter ATP-binding protein [Numidum massiliense]
MTKGDIRFIDVEKRFGDVQVIPPLRLTVRSGERLVLLGPSGCGKTTVMRLIAGLEEPSAGEIYFGDQCVNDVDASERHVAMVFQNYALYPHLSVLDNLTFSLKLRKVKRQQREARARVAARMVNIEHLLQRKPRELSGGQRQRVALARAAVREAPYFLLDEPLSNLDAQLRHSAREELVELHEKLRTTMVYVTHDQVEAMTVGQRIAVLKDGQLQQIGTPQEIYEQPGNVFVARFVGSPTINIVSVWLEGEGIVVAEASDGKPIRSKGQVLPLPQHMRFALEKHVRGNGLQLGVRPEDVRIVSKGIVSTRATITSPEAVTTSTTDCIAGSCASAIRIHGRLVRVEYLGHQYVYHVRVGSQILRATRTGALSGAVENSKPDQPVLLELPLANVHFFQADGDETRIELPLKRGEAQRRVGAQTEERMVLSG